jgi:hypothetical protein
MSHYWRWTCNFTTCSSLIYQHISTQIMFIPDENPWVKVETCDCHPFLSKTNRGLLMDWILLTQTSGCSRKAQYAPNISIYNLLRSQCMPKNEHYSSICTTARENVLLFHMAKGTAKARPPLPCGSELVRSERKESHSSFLIPLYAQHNIKLLQSLQTITDQKTNCLLVFLVPIPFHFRPDSLFQISSGMRRSTAGRAQGCAEQSDWVSPQ